MNTTTTVTTRPLGHIDTINAALDQPQMKALSLSIKSITLMCGMNGTGKSFVLAMSWFMGWVSNAIILYVQKLPQGVNIQNVIKEAAQFGQDKTFDLKDIHGSVECIYQSGFSLKVTWDKGKIVDISWNGLTNEIQPQQMIYMSSAMRTFENISMYLKFRKQKISAQSIAPEMIVYLMAEDFKLYDVLYIEKLIAISPQAIDPSMQDHLAHFIDPKEKVEMMKIFGVDLNKCEFWVGDSNEKRFISSYSKGEQAIINMALGALFTK